MSVSQKRIIAFSLALILLLLTGLALAECKIGSKSISATAKYQLTEKGYKPYAG